MGIMDKITGKAKQAFATSPATSSTPPPGPR